MSQKDFSREFFIAFFSIFLKQKGHAVHIYILKGRNYNDPKPGSRAVADLGERPGKTSLPMG